MTEELIFRTQVQTGDSAKQVDKVTTSLDGLGKKATESGTVAEQSLKALNKTVEDGNYTMRSAAKLVQEYGAIALKAGRESPVGKEALKQAAELRDKIGDLNNEINSLAHDGANMQAALQLGTSVVAGYGALQGIMALTGVENEALQKSLVKLQAVQTVLMSVEQLRANLEKESFLMIKAKVVWTKVATATEYVYATAIGTTTGAMKALKIAMLAIPIILILAGIIALIAIIASFMKQEELAEDQNNALNASFERQNEALEKNGRAYKRNSDNKRALMVSENASAEELHRFDLKRLEDEEIARRKNISLLKDIIPQKTLAYKQALKEENFELAKTIKEETKQMRSKYNDFRELDGQYAVDRKLMENKYQAELDKQTEEAKKAQQAKNADAYKKMLERKAQQNKDRIEKERLLEDLIATNIVDAEDRKLTQLKISHSRQLQEVVDKYGKESEIVKQLEQKQLAEVTALKKEYIDAQQEQKAEAEAKAKAKAEAEAEEENRSRRAELEGKLIELREDFDQQQKLKAELAQFEMEQALLQEGVTEGEKFKIKQEYLVKIDELKTAQAEKDKQREKDVVQAGKQVMEMGLAAAQNLSDAFFDNKLSKAKKGSAEELAIEKKKFEVNKKLQIAQAVMQGIQATLAAFSSGSAIPIVGAVTGPAFAAMAGITSALNISKIANTNFSSSASSAGSSSGASTPSVNIPSISSATPQSADTSTLTKGLNGSGAKEKDSQKVYIVDNEIKQAMNRSVSVDILSSIG